MAPFLDCCLDCGCPFVRLLLLPSIYCNQHSYSLFVATTSTYLLLTLPLSPDDSLPQKVSTWATLLGVSSAILAAIQYAPQLLHTYRSKLVGALSIPMMMIQTPGGFLMVTSIALRPGTNWTSMNLSLKFLHDVETFFYRLDNVSSCGVASGVSPDHVHNLENPPTQARDR